MGTSKKISGPNLSGLGKGANRNPMASNNNAGGGVSLSAKEGRKPGAPTDMRDAGSHSIGAKERRISNAPTDMKTK